MPVEILMPALSPTMEEGTLAKWLVKEGDSVTSGQVIAEIETDKATMEFEAVDEGIIGKIVIAEGTEDELAARSQGGRPIIALPSTARGGEVSRLVPTLMDGAGVVTSRGDVHYVVTEHGVADLYAKSTRERAKALIGIAHPKFREELEKRAYELNIIHG